MFLALAPSNKARVRSLMITRILITTCLLVQVVVSTAADNTPAKSPEPSAEQECLSKGGRWEGTIQELGRLTGCSLPTSDGGKPCNDSKQCESVCVQCKCYAWSQYKGCGIMVDGRILCID